MGYLRFHRSTKLFPGVRLNMSKSGPSVSLGVKGARYNIGPRGTRATLGIPGSGLEYIHQERWGKGKRTAPTPQTTAVGTFDDVINALKWFAKMMVWLFTAFVVFVIFAIMVATIVRPHEQAAAVSEMVTTQRAPLTVAEMIEKVCSGGGSVYPSEQACHKDILAAYRANPEEERGILQAATQ